MRSVRDSHETHLRNVVADQAKAALPAGFVINPSLGRLPEGSIVSDCRNGKVGEWKPSKRIGTEPNYHWLVFYAAPVQA